MRRACVMAALLGTMAAAACATPEAPAAPVEMPTATPDPCDRAHIEAGVRGINQLMREFDDASALASNVPRDNLADHIALLQGLRREAQDQSVPKCLERLRTLQVLHMNLVIETLMAFISGSGSQEEVTRTVAAAQLVHNQYMLEAAGLLGLTPVVVTTVPTAGAGTAGATSDPTALTEAGATTPQPAVPPTPTVLAINGGPNAITLRAEMSEASAAIGTLQAGESAVAIGISPDSTWIKVIVPGSSDLTAWILANEVQLTSTGP